MIKGLVFIPFIFLVCIASRAQSAFQTIVTQGPVVAGESFQVQYVIEGLEKNDEFFAPDFNQFRFVSGPNIYAGSVLGVDGPKKLKNIVYTLVAIRPGKFIIPGASARIGDKLIKSENAWLEVISKADAFRKGKMDIQESNADYFLGPGEDPYAKMQRNLFIKVLVDKRACFVGEPVTATFKLYSRLESKSDIVKNPGFYGFTVQDMISIADKLATTETINGKKFDVHVVRKVQLYPLQRGLFSIDAMEVQNKVEFSKSAVSKKTEQEIAEGVYPDNSIADHSNTVVYENNMSTEPIAITVKPTPPKNKPAEYNGATGNFRIVATVEKNSLAKNEEGDLIIAISGKGNFTQLSAPVVQWPVGIEGFEPTAKDSLDHDQSPLNGKRMFRFRFVSAREGNYVLPAVSFSFFNPDSNSYKTIITQALNISITNKEKNTTAITPVDKKMTRYKSRWKWWATGAIAVIFMIVLGTWLRKNKRIIKPVTVAEKPNTVVSVTEILKTANTFCDADDKTFYSILGNCIWNFFTQHFGLTGSKMNKTGLAEVMQMKAVDPSSQKKILEILDHCETGVFTNIEGAGDKKSLLEEAKNVLVKISSQLRS
jgi:hypothetical protein